MRVAVTGATGLVGEALVAALVERGDEVLAFSRDPDRAAESLPPGVDTADWTPDRPGAMAKPLSGVDAIVNLAGEPVLGRRWNAKVKDAIRESRVVGTRALIAAMSAASPAPRTLVSASAVGYYGPRSAETFGEDAAAGDDFLARVCVDWEAEAKKAGDHGARVALLRLGIVLAAEGGALRKMLPPFKWFVGGRVGSGRQGFPWVHLDDVVGIAIHCLDREDVSGAFNVTAPNPVTNREFCKTLGRALRRPSWLPVPKLMLRLVMGPAAGILVTGQNPLPERVTTAGYHFRFPEAQGALEDLLG